MSAHSPAGSCRFRNSLSAVYSPFGKTRYAAAVTTLCDGAPGNSVDDHSLVLSKVQAQRLVLLARSTLVAITALDRTDDSHYAFLVALYAECGRGPR